MKELLFLYKENFLGTKVFRHNVIPACIKKIKSSDIIPF